MTDQPISNYDIAPNVELQHAPDELGDYWIASFKDFGHRGCWGDGDSVQEALDELADCLPGWHAVGGTENCTCVFTFTGAV